MPWFPVCASRRRRPPRALDQLTPYDLTAAEIPESEGYPRGSARLAFRVDGLTAGKLPGMDEDGDCLNVIVEYKLGDEPWSRENSYSAKTMLDEYQGAPGVMSRKKPAANGKPRPTSRRRLCWVTTTATRARRAPSPCR